MTFELGGYLIALIYVVWRQFKLDQRVEKLEGEVGIRQWWIEKFNAYIEGKTEELLNEPKQHKQ